MTRLLAPCLVAVALACAAAPAAAEIAFTSGRCAGGGLRALDPDHVVCASGIFRVHDDGSGMKRLTKGTSEDPEQPYWTLSGDSYPQWSPDGTRIAFTRQTGSYAWRVFAMNADGSDQHQLQAELPEGYDTEESPAWSPDGKLIALVAMVADPRPQDKQDHPLVLVNADGTQPRVISTPGWVTAAPSFTPDGRHVMFVGYPDPHRDEFGSTQGESALYMTDLDGGNMKRLAFGDIPLRGDAMSPDGRYVAVMERGTVSTMRIDGSELRTYDDLIGLGPTWSSEGPTVFFTGYPPPGTYGDSAIFKLDVSKEAGPVQVTHPRSYDGIADWALVNDEAPVPARAKDKAAPGVVTGDELGGAASTARAKTNASRRPRVPFLVVDASGIRRVRASVAMRVHGGCRWLHGHKLQSRTSCSKPFWFRVRTASGWRARTDHLQDGKYYLRFRTTDVKGHTTKHPRKHVVRLR